jgi:signal transduction histidine kinase
MNAASILSMASSVVAANAAVFHVWLYALRRKDPANFWLAVTALGVSGMGTSSALLFNSMDVTRSDQLQRLLLACSAPVVLGFFHYSHLYLALDRPHVDKAIAWVSVSIVLVTAWPGLVFDGVGVLREIGTIDAVYVESSLSLFGKLFVSVFFPIYGYLIHLYIRFLRRDDPNRWVLTVMLGLFAVSFGHDICLAMGLIESPALISVGLTAFLIGLSSIQVRQFVASMETVERNAEHLNDLVEERTEELRQKELQLAHGAQMATIGALAANLAHEINNPIAYVSSNLNRMSEWGDDPDCDEDMGEMLVESREGLGRIRTIVSSLLGLARRSDGVDQPVDLHTLIESVLPIVRREAKYRARLETRLDQVPWVMGDPRLLGHVILSLLMNALRTIPEGAPEENYVRITTREEVGNVVLAISDSGPGNPDSERPIDLDAILGSTSPVDSASLGLAVTKQIIERHHGKIEVDTSHEGMCISVRLPTI